MRGSDDVDSEVVHHDLEHLPAAAVHLCDGVVVAANVAAVELLRPDDRGPAAGDEENVVGRRLDSLLVPLDDGVELTRPAVPPARARGPRHTVIEVRIGIGHEPSATHLALLLDVTAEARASSIVSLLGDSTIVLTPSGSLRWRTGQMAEARDQAGAAPGGNPLELVHPEDLPSVLDTFVRALGRPGTRFRITARTQPLGRGDSWQWDEIIGVAGLDAVGVDGLVAQISSVAPADLPDGVSARGDEFQSLTDAAPVGLIFGDFVGDAIYINPAARRMLRIDPDAGMAGRDWTERFDDASRAAMRAAVDAAVYEGEVQTHTVQVMHHDGTQSFLRVNVTPRMTDGHQAVGIISTLDDVTSEVEARAEVERLREMLDASPDYVAVFRPGEGPLYANRAMRRLVGDTGALRSEDHAAPFDPDSGFDRLNDRQGRLLQLIPEEQRERWLDGAREVLATEDSWQGEFEFQHPDGTRFPVSTLVVVRRTDDGALDWVAMLARDISELKAAEDRLRQAATHDHLTGLPNRPLFNDRLARAVARHRRTRQGLAVLFCDLDGFKEINDTFGHAVGDELLTVVAERLADIVRETDTAARVGGDEFVVVAEGVTDTEVLATLAERIIEAVSQRVVMPDGTQLRVGISVGIGVALPRNGDVEADALLSLADSAMYRAKARGGNRYRIMPLAIG